MRVPVEWLRSIASVAVSTDELAERLTDAGFEVETIHRAGEHWDSIVVGQVVKIDPHPNADRLNLPTVDFGSDRLQVVCGAWNFGVGDKIAFAPAGAALVDPYADEPILKELKPARIRGVESRGMLCSPKELGLDDSHEGILILDADAPVGAPLRSVLGDDVIEFELKANRPDALSVIGIAREVAALLDAPLTLPGPASDDAGAALDLSVEIEIEDPDLCPRYSAAFVADVTVADSPAWLRRRLELAGMRPINNIVDATNYVMLEFGQPMHAFDWDTLRGGRIVVRLPRPGERLTTLDGQDRDLASDTLLIADAERPIALAGVMGGAETEVSRRTTTVLLESATFDQFSIRRTARRLALPSEASRRFEKGLPPELTTVALRRCAQLIEQIGAGKAAFLSGDAYPAPSALSPVRLGFDRIERLVGVRYERDEVRRILSAVGFSIDESGDELAVTPPYWRRDVSYPADVIEEVARLTGYGRIPNTLPTGLVTAGVPGEVDSREDRVRDVLAGLGFTEVIGYALTSKARMARLIPPGVLAADDSQSAIGDPSSWTAVRADAMNAAGRAVADRLLPLDRTPVELRNPLSRDDNVLRLTGLSTMLETLRANLRHTDRDLLLFEYAPSFFARPGDLPSEPRTVTIVAGDRYTSGRWDETSATDLLFMKGAVDELLRRFGVAIEPRDGREPSVRHVPLVHPTFATDQAAAVLDGEAAIAAYGQIDARVAGAFDLDAPVWAALIDGASVLRHGDAERAFRGWSSYPPARRDLAIVVGADTHAGDVELAIRRTGRQLVQDLRLFDEYRGDQIPPDKRSLAFAISYGAADRTLTDAEADKVHARIVKALAKRFGAELRA